MPVVYAIEVGAYEQAGIEAIFSTEELAIAYLEAAGNKRREHSTAGSPSWVKRHKCEPTFADEKWCSYCANNGYTIDEYELDPAPNVVQSPQ